MVPLFAKLQSVSPESLVENYYRMARAWVEPGARDALYQCSRDAMSVIPRSEVVFATAIAADMGRDCGDEIRRPPSVRNPWLITAIEIEVDDHTSCPAALRELGRVQQLGVSIVTRTLSDARKALQWAGQKIPCLADGATAVIEDLDQRAGVCEVHFLGLFACIDGIPVITPGIARITTDEKGAIEDVKNFRMNTVWDEPLGPWLNVPLEVLGRLNCSNVGTLDVTEEKGPPAKWLRRSKTAPLRYHVLVVDPGRRRARKATEVAGEASTVSQHVVRGHYMHHPDGLFNRTPGIPSQTWVPQHAKGNPDRGVVLKDYRLVTNGVTTAI